VPDSSIKWVDPTIIRETDYDLVELYPYSKEWQLIVSRLQVQHRFGDHFLKDKGDKISFEFEREYYLAKKNLLDDCEISIYKLNEPVDAIL